MYYQASTPENSLDFIFLSLIQATAYPKHESLGRATPDSVLKVPRRALSGKLGLCACSCWQRSRAIGVSVQLSVGKKSLG